MTNHVVSAWEVCLREENRLKVAENNGFEALLFELSTQLNEEFKSFASD